MTHGLMLPEQVAKLVRWSPDQDFEILYLQSAGDTFQWPVIVIDDFFRDPDLVRDLAASLDYHHRRASYPGLDASIAIPGWPLVDVVAGLCKRVYATLWGIPVTGTGNRISFGNGSTCPPSEAVPATRAMHDRWRVPIRQLVANDIVTFSIMKVPKVPEFFPGDFDIRTPVAHCDRVQNDQLVFSVLVYLNPDIQYGGTIFLRHKPSGMVAMPSPGQAFLSRALERQGLRSPAALRQHITWPSIRHTGHIDAWTVETNVAMKYNRFVAFPGNLLHSIDMDHLARQPRTLDECRLTLNAFIEVFAPIMPGAESEPATV